MPKRRTEIVARCRECGGRGEQPCRVCELRRTIAAGKTRTFPDSPSVDPQLVLDLTPEQQKKLGELLRRKRVEASVVKPVDPRAKEMGSGVWVF